MTIEHREIEPHIREAMNKVGRLLSKAFEPHGFALLVFNLNSSKGDDRMNYISNAKRSDMLVAMKEFIAKCEGRAPDDVPTTRQ